MGGASVISTSAMFTDEECGGGTAVPRMKKNEFKNCVSQECESEFECECLMATRKPGSCCQQRRLETRKLGSKPNVRQIKIKMIRSATLL